MARTLGADRPPAAAAHGRARGLAGASAPGDVPPGPGPRRLPPRQLPGRRARSALLAVIDWEMATIGDPLLDLGLLVAFWGPRAVESAAMPALQAVSRRPGAPPVERLVARYEAADRSRRRRCRVLPGAGPVQARRDRRGRLLPVPGGRARHPVRGGARVATCPPCSRRRGPRRTERRWGGPQPCGAPVVPLSPPRWPGSSMQEQENHEVAFGLWYDFRNPVPDRPFSTFYRRDARPDRLGRGDRPRLGLAHRAPLLRRRVHARRRSRWPRRSANGPGGCGWART